MLAEIGKTGQASFLAVLERDKTASRRADPSLQIPRAGHLTDHSSWHLLFRRRRFMERSMS